MTYRNGFTDVSPGADTPIDSSTESAPAQSFGATTFGDDIGPPSAGNFVSDTGGDSGLVLTLNSVDLNLDDAGESRAGRHCPRRRLPALWWTQTAAVSTLT
jgi:hypothetical protein